MQLPEGTWVAVDQGQPMRAPYRVCFKVGCVADYPASGELIDTLKRDKDLIIRGVDSEAG